MNRRNLIIAGLAAVVIGLSVIALILPNAESGELRPSPVVLLTPTLPPPNIVVPDVGGGAGDVPDPDLGTDEFDVAEAQPTQIASIPLQIIDRSGIAVGDGSLRVYHQNEVRYPNTTRVELELRFDNRYITATPFSSDVTVVPVATSTLSPSPTPRDAQVVVPNQPFFQRMGASLLCAPNSFEGCDTPGYIPEQAQLLRYSGTSWTWLLSPSRDLTVDHDLTIQLWRVVEVEGEEQAVVEREIPFTLRVLAANATEEGQSLLLALAGVGVALGLVGGGVFLWQRRSKPAVAHTTPRIFISYRRNATWAAARSLHDTLAARGADVFIDVDDINEGRFEEIIKDAIEAADYFILVLSPQTLESEWVVKETTYALEHGKRIIPVLVDGFDLYRYPLPEALRKITSHNAVTLTPEFFKAGIDRIAEFVGLGGRN
jgi:hypothetical protein